MRRGRPGRGTALVTPFTPGGTGGEPRVRQGWFSMRGVPGLRG